MPTIYGIHHVTAIASDPQKNLDFYTQVLGLRLVKLTVNFDAPDTYHFYLADAVGNPGTILTFFPWPGAHHGVIGTRQAGALAFAIPPGSLSYWSDRLKRYDQLVPRVFERFGEEGIAFQDPDGLQLELIAEELEPAEHVDAWQSGGVPGEQAIGGIHSLTLLEGSIAATAQLLTGTFGLTRTQQTGERTRFEASPGLPGRIVDLVNPAGSLPGRMGAGIIHHVAWRTPDSEQQLLWREILVDQRINATPVMDRSYFQSIYFREPGGVLFEIATELPGFTIDEDIDCLGSSLKLPPWMELQREEIIHQLPELRLPVGCPEPA